MEIYKDSFIPSRVVAVIDKLISHGYDAYIVGGAVRDMIRGLPVGGFDVTSSASYEELCEAFPDGVRDERHSSVIVTSDTQAVIVTPYRSDGMYGGVSSIYDDLSRRDFTVNAVAITRGAVLEDPFGGCEDIKRKVIRCVGDPDVRFGEDYLSIMRALRFSSLFGFRIEKKTDEAIHRNAHKISLLPPQSVFPELCGILNGEDARRCLADYSDVIGCAVPKLRECIGFEQNDFRQCSTLYEHLVSCVSYTPREIHLRLAALFHDIGKLSAGEGGDGHEEAGAEAAEAALHAFCANTKLTESVCRLIRYHGEQIPADKIAVKRLMSKLTVQGFYDLLQLQRSDILSQSPRYYYRLETINKLKETADLIAETGTAIALSDVRINGHDIMSLGVSRGREVGRLLRLAHEAVISESVVNDRACLLEYIKQHQSGEGADS